jgi:uncharacterized protein (TIGR02001 family)
VNAHHAIRAAIATLCLAASEAEAQLEPSSLDVYVTLATDYLHRGMSQTDDDAALQVGVDYRHRSGFFVGAWASNVDYRTEQLRARPREREFDYYVGIDKRRERWAWAATLARYTYPGVSFDYDYTELSVGASFRQRLSYRASYSDNLLSIGHTALGQEVGISIPLLRNLELGATLGHFRSSDIPGGDYVHFNVGVSKLVSAFTFDLRYYDTHYAVTTHLGRPADRRWVASFSYGYGAR